MLVSSTAPTKKMFMIILSVPLVTSLRMKPCALHRGYSRGRFVRPALRMCAHPVSIARIPASREWDGA
jgi:hypothetical protein